MVLTPDLAAFLQTGVCLVVATRDATFAPSCAYAGGLRVAPDRRHVTIFLPAISAGTCIRNAGGCEIALTACRPIDYRTIQLKGRVEQVAPAAEEDARFVAAYKEALAAQLERVGTVRELTLRLRFWPSVAVTVALRELFEQTPGPRAGVRMEAR